jgi:hypothetical protein
MARAARTCIVRAHAPHQLELFSDGARAVAAAPKSPAPLLTLAELRHMLGVCQVMRMKPVHSDRERDLLARVERQLRWRIGEMSTPLVIRPR